MEKKLFRNTIRLLQLTKDCKKEDQEILLTYIASLENTVLDYMSMTNVFENKKITLEKIIKE